MTELTAKYAISLPSGTHVVTHNLSSFDVMIEGAVPGWHVIDANTICVTLFRSTRITVLA